MKGMVRRVLLLVALMLAPLALGFVLGRNSMKIEPLADALTGPLRVIDGDTFDVGTTRVRLHGVDAPETAQTCLEADGTEWHCGTWATDEARVLWDGRDADCEVLETDRYGRAVSRCMVDGEDVGAALVSRGLAMAYVAYSEDYLPQQRQAEAQGAGLWRGTFQPPWEWRQAPREPEVAEVETVSAEREECLIKGNISGRGRLYHLPGGSSYDRTRIDEAAGERWFCTAAEAEAAGWRAAR
jgi:endonuclease YncB( thermonuclease family)